MVPDGRTIKFSHHLSNPFSRLKSGPWQHARDWCLDRNRVHCLYLVASTRKQHRRGERAQRFQSEKMRSEPEPEPEPEPDRPFPPLCLLTVPLSRVVQNAQVEFVTVAYAAERKKEHVLDGWGTKAASMLQSHTVQPEQINQGAGQRV